MDDTLPLDLGLLEIDEKTEGPAGGSQIVETLRDVFVGEVLYTLQLDHQHVFDEDVSKIFPHGVAFVGDCKGNLSDSADPAKAEFSEESTLVHLLEESGAKGVGYFADCAKHTPSQRSELRTSICRH